MLFAEHRRRWVGQRRPLHGFQAGQFVCGSQPSIVSVAAKGTSWSSMFASGGRRPRSPGNDFGISIRTCSA
jgi:hypothetical protein